MAFFHVAKKSAVVVVVVVVGGSVISASGGFATAARLAERVRGIVVGAVWGEGVEMAGAVATAGAEIAPAAPCEEQDEFGKEEVAGEAGGGCEGGEGDGGEGGPGGWGVVVGDEVGGEEGEEDEEREKEGCGGG